MKQNDPRRQSRRQLLDIGESSQFVSLASSRLRQRQHDELREQFRPLLKQLEGLKNDKSLFQSHSTVPQTPQTHEQLLPSLEALHFAIQLPWLGAREVLELLEFLVFLAPEQIRIADFIILSQHHDWPELRQQFPIQLRLLSLVQQLPALERQVSATDQLQLAEMVAGSQKVESRDKEDNVGTGILGQILWANFCRRLGAEIPDDCRAAWLKLAGPYQRHTAMQVHAPDMPDPFFDGHKRKMERQPRRQFGAHGGDYEFGSILTLNMRLEHRLLYLDQAMFRSTLGDLNRLAELCELPRLSHCIFAEGYGFGWDEQFRPVDEQATEFVDLVNTWKILPGILEYGGRRPFDVLVSDDQLQERFWRDMMTHTARSPKAPDGPYWDSPGMSVLKRVGPGRNNAIPDCSDLLEIAQEVYCEPGWQGLEKFVTVTKNRPQRFLPFSED